MAVDVDILIYRLGYDYILLNSEELYQNILNS